jgi:hypothetical protein
VKKTFLALFAFLPALAGADIVTEEKIKQALNIETMQQLIQPKKVAEGIYTPFAAWYVANKDIAPSCALIDKDDVSRALEIMSPSDGQFTNCHQTIDDPIISFVRGSYYATYKYVTEETRASFSTNYQLVKLTKDGFYPCEKDQAISKNLLTNVNSKGMKLNAAVEKAIKKFGCAETQHSE